MGNVSTLVLNIEPGNSLLLFAKVFYYSVVARFSPAKWQSKGCTHTNIVIGFGYAYVLI